MSPSNYRPISNLSIHFNILERVISFQLITYLTTNKFPTSFRVPTFPTKSTESALTLITSDLLSGLNNNRGSILVLLDMSSAFDTLDHNFLIPRLSTIGINGIALNWLTSYISNRSFTVMINSYSSLPALSPRVFPRVLLLVLYVLTFTSSPYSKSFPTTHTFPFIPTPMTFNSTSTAPTPPLMPPTDSPLASTPYTNGLLPTPLNLTPPKPKLSFFTYPYVPPPSLNHPHHTKHNYPLLL